MSAPRAHLISTVAKDYVDRLVVANGQTKAGLLAVHTFSIADAATADYDITILDSFEVLDVVVQKRGGTGTATCTLTVKSTADAITDAIDVADVDTTLSRAATIDDAYSTIAAGGVLRCSVVDGGNSAIFVSVIGIVRA